MSVLSRLQFTTGSTTGRDHRTSHLFLPNQDAVRAERLTNGRIIGAISDGCGSQPYSQFGAMLTVNVLMRELSRLRPNQQLTDRALARIYKQLVSSLVTTATQLHGDNLDARLNEYMLATAGGVLIDAETTTFFGAGDFVLAVNDHVEYWEPEPGNRPLYPALSIGHRRDERFKFRVTTFPTSRLRKFMFSTDGALDLLEACQSDLGIMPGTDDELVGPLDKLWENDGLYKGPDELTTWLNGVAQDWRKPGPPHHHGLLSDDTTMIIGRRKP